MSVPSSGLAPPNRGPAADSSRTIDAPVPAPAGDGSFQDDTLTAQLTVTSGEPAATAEPRVDPVVGSILASRYVLEEIIGRGGTALIFRAREIHPSSIPAADPRYMAIKLLHGERRWDTRAIGRLQREFRQLQCLRHPGIVRVIDLQCDGDIWFMTMELVAGRTVKAWMDTAHGQAEALQVVAACCEALQYAHTQGIVHGDLKPTNVMVADDRTVRLIDFGSAPDPGPSDAQSERPLALTPLFASPQVLAGHPAERRDDVYSLACLTYFILSKGRHPFGGHPSLEDGRVKSAPTYVRAMDRGLFQVIERGLSAEHKRRPASARAFLRELGDAERLRSAALGASAVLSRPATPRHPRSARDAAVAPWPATLTACRRRIRSGLRRWTAVAFRGAVAQVITLARVITLFVAMVGAALLTRWGVHRETRPPVPWPPTAAARAAVGKAPVRAVAVLETRAPRHRAGVISFTTATIHASALQPLVALSVTRGPASGGRGSFRWRVERGTAYPGLDYAPQAPQLVRFIDGQVVRTLYVPLLNARATAASPARRRFTVALEPVAGGPLLGRFSRVTVDIDPKPTPGPPAADLLRTEP